MGKQKKKSRFEKGHKHHNKYAKHSNSEETLNLKGIVADKKERQEAEKSYKEAVRLFKYEPKWLKKNGDRNRRNKKGKRDSGKTNNGQSETSRN